MNKPVSLIADLIDLLDADLRYQFEERAGIIEFDGEQPRDLAECLALLDLLRAHPGALLGFTALHVERNGVTQILVTTDAEAVRDRLRSHNVAVIDRLQLAHVLKKQFGGLALLSYF